MKVTIQKSKKKEVERTYPYFGEGYNTGKIIFFYSKNAGIVIDPGDSALNAGEIGSCFHEGQYTPVTDPILIEP
jgi:hypothetical protein